MSTGLIAIGFYSAQHYTYTSIATWSNTLLIVLGCLLFLIGLFGYDAISKMKKRNIKYHIIMLLFCLVLMIIATIGFFWIASTVNKVVSENWNIIHESLETGGYNIRKSFLINQIEINLKLAGYFSSIFIVFLLISLSSSIYQHSLI